MLEEKKNKSAVKKEEKEWSLFPAKNEGGKKGGPLVFLSSIPDVVAEERATYWGKEGRRKKGRRRNAIRGKYHLGFDREQKRRKKKEMEKQSTAELLSKQFVQFSHCLLFPLFPFFFLPSSHFLDEM